jgi:CRP-like cAMP-binding protein
MGAVHLRILMRLTPTPRSNVNQPTLQYRNRVLTALPKAELGRMERHLSPVMRLEQEQTLLDGTAEYGYFLEDGIASIVSTLANGDTVEVGIVGIDGVVGVPILLGTEGGPGRTFIQIAGTGFRINAEFLKAEFERSGVLRKHLQKYLQGFFVQTAQTAVCNRLHNIEERLSRWLLSCRDRMESDQLRLTHDFLGQMLGAPRTTVTLAAGLLHRAGLIDYSRGLVTIRDRTGLEGAACECYRIVRDEFVRLGLL